MLDKSYDSQSVEDRIYQVWTKANAFAAGAGAKPGAESYSIVVPPPNVTGSLHVGHALNITLQDILVRFERMRGKDVLWQPGMDHAGIATQMIVERQLMERQEPARREMGREKFIERVWEWKAESGGQIIHQQKKLGASCDWSRERFTLDEGLSEAVRKWFVDLHKKGLLYRAKRLVNWHPVLQTAISDLEVENIEINGKMWHLRYPLADGATYAHPVEFDEDGNPTAFETRNYIIVATTRPETMLGDTAIAVNPEDERYRHLIGKFAELPLVGRRLQIVGDEHADPAQGSGAVKITPAHDFNDFEVGQRHDLEQINIFGPDARINDNAPEAYRGLDRFAAREKVLDELETLGVLDHVEDKKIMVPHDEKTKLFVIEPYLTDQWFVDAKTLAGPALDAVRDGRTQFVPKNWENTYFSWMENIQPWCVSRQLWWGHQIPAWYGPDGEVFVAYNEEEAAKAATSHYGQVVKLVRDEDVLDTWFSSALWAFSTLGWPEKTSELERYFPTSVLVTGFDIIFFWVARMMMASLDQLNEEPFKRVYVHALIRDEHGQKMSKTKGNVINPLDLVSEYGADATRFTLAAMAAQGRDMRLAVSRVEGYRNFVTKIWNAVRFLEMNACETKAGFDPANVQLPLNQWIIGATARAATNVTRGLEDLRFNEAAGAAYDFVWGTFCDWYIELSKPVLSGQDGQEKAETQATAAYVRDRILHMLHPFMPFVTEELWAKTAPSDAPRDQLLVLSEWPVLVGLETPSADVELEWLVALVSGIRSVRSEMNVPAGAKVTLEIVGAGTDTRSKVERNQSAIERLARVEKIAFVDKVPQNAAQLVLEEATFAMPLGGVIDIAAEKARLAKDIGKLEAEISKLDKKLGNAQFLAKAPDEVVAEQRARREDAGTQRDRVAAALSRLG